MRRYSILIGIGLCAATALAAAEETLFIQSERAALHERPSLDAEQIGEAVRGEAAVPLDEEDGWFQVRIEEREGWVSDMLLDEQAPADGVGALSGDQELEVEGRRRASAVATAGGVRGLEEDEELLQDENVDVDQLHVLESRPVSTERALEFLRSDDDEEAS